MEDLAEEAGKGVLRLIGVAIRSVVWLIWNLFFEILAWYAGWPICRVLSLGRYPGEGFHGYDDARPLHSFLVSLIGLVSLVALGGLIAQVVGSP